MRQEELLCILRGNRMGTGWGKFYCKVSGNYNKALKYLSKAQNLSVDEILNKYGQMGVDALSKATPVDTGKTAASWYYEIGSKQKSGGRKTHYYINWHNSNENKYVNIALIIQYGHGTYQGTYIQGIDYINPAIQPIFDQIVSDIDGEVKGL